MKTKGIYSNCPFGVFYLLLRGKAVKWVLTPGGNWLIPFHQGILTRHGHYLHFYRNLPHSQNPYGAWWFLGSFQGHTRSRWLEALSERGKVTVLPVTIALILLPLCYMLLFVPWCLAWFLYGPYWTISWGLSALRKNVGLRRCLQQIKTMLSNWGCWSCDSHCEPCSSS